MISVILTPAYTRVKHSLYVLASLSDTHTHTVMKMISEGDVSCSPMLCVGSQAEVQSHYCVDSMQYTTVCTAKRTTSVCVFNALSCSDSFVSNTLAFLPSHCYSNYSSCYFSIEAICAHIKKVKTFHPTGPKSALLFCMLTLNYS